MMISMVLGCLLAQGQDGLDDFDAKTLEVYRTLDAGKGVPVPMDRVPEQELNKAASELAKILIPYEQAGVSKWKAVRNADIQSDYLWIEPMKGSSEIKFFDLNGTSLLMFRNGMFRLFEDEVSAIVTAYLKPKLNLKETVEKNRYMQVTKVEKLGKWVYRGILKYGTQAVSRGEMTVFEDVDTQDWYSFGTFMVDDGVLYVSFPNWPGTGQGGGYVEREEGWWKRFEPK